MRQPLGTVDYQRPTAWVLVWLLVVLSLGAVVGAQDGDWQLTRDSVETARVPDSIAAHPVLAELEIDPGQRELIVARHDLNADGSAEYFVQSASSLCGNGGLSLCDLRRPQS